MRSFAALYDALDRTTSTNKKVAALAAYFAAAPPDDAAWALYFLTGRKIKRLIPSRVLWELTRDLTGWPEWLLEHCYAAVGDFAEAMALLSDRGDEAVPVDLPLSRWITERVIPLKDMDAAQQREAMRRYWSELDVSQTFVLNRIITGEFRVGASATLVVRALAQVAGVPPATMAHRVMGDWAPTPEFFQGLVAAATAEPVASRPYPFFLASPLEQAVETLGPREDWLAEWKWDGIRAQIVRRQGAVFVWSRGEELLAGRFPELEAAATHLPDGVVLDGEVLAYRDGVLPFAVLQTRIGRQKLTPKVLSDAPVAFMAYDLLEDGGADIRERPLSERRERLKGRLAGVSPRVLVSPEVEAPTWTGLAALRDEARRRNVEGLMLKRRASPYQAGRRRGDWWKWKIDPFTVDAVMIYAHPATDGAPPSSRTTPSASGTKASSCRWPRPTRASPTRRSWSWTPGSGATRSRSTGPRARWSRPSSSSSPSRGSRPRRGIARASLCASRASCAGGGTSPPRKRTRWRGCAHCCGHGDGREGPQSSAVRPKTSTSTEDA